MRILRSLAILCLLLPLGACASIIRGTTSDFKIQTIPEGAAIKTSNGHSCTATPCEFKVKRKEEFTIFAEKAGYKPARLDVKTKMSGKGFAATVGNGLIGGIVGVSIDAHNGATLDHHPNPAILTLEPETPAKQTGPRRHRAPQDVKPVS
jgi:hypothetical protein